MTGPTGLKHPYIAAYQCPSIRTFRHLDFQTFELLEIKTFRMPAITAPRRSKCWKVKRLEGRTPQCAGVGKDGGLELERGTAGQTGSWKEGRLDFWTAGLLDGWTFGRRGGGGGVNNRIRLFTPRGGAAFPTASREHGLSTGERGRAKNPYIYARNKNHKFIFGKFIWLFKLFRYSEGQKPCSKRPEI